MWDTAVSFGHTVLEHTAEEFRQHPIVGTAVLTTQSVLTILFGLEGLRAFRTTKPADPWTDGRPVRVRR